MRVDLRRLSLLFAVILVAAGLAAQSVVAHRLDELDVPSQDIKGIYHGPRGGMYILTERGNVSEISVHDGERWALSHRLAPGEKVLTTLYGELLLANESEIFTFEWRFRAPARRLLLGRLRTPYTITRATYLMEVGSQTLQRHPEVVLETNRGILVSSGGKFHQTTSGRMRLLGVSPLGAFVANPAGEVFAVGRRRQVVAHLATDMTDLAPVATTSGGDIIFRGGGAVHLLQLNQAERYRIRRIVDVPSQCDLTVVGNRLLRLSPGEPLMYCDLQAGSEWRPMHFGGSDAQSASPLAVGGAGSFYSIGSRAIVRTQTGIVSVESLPNVTIPVQIDAALTSAIGAAGSELVVGQPDAVKVYGTDPAAGPTPRRSWPTFDNYMRNSVPTCVASFAGRIVVGTSDGRVLGLNPGGPPELLSSVVGYGMEFSDLYVTDQALWATFNPGSGRNSGLVKITRGASGLQLDSTGLEGSVACVRQAPRGRLYAAARRGASPLYYYYAAHNLWMKLGGKVEMAANHQGFEVHEIAPASDSLIYVATSRGLLQWTRARGYRAVPMPHDLLDADIRSVALADGGLWFTVQGQGAYFLRDGNLHTVEGAHNWTSFDFQPRGLTTLDNGDVLLLNGGRVVKLDSPTDDYMPLRPGIIVATHPGASFGSRVGVGERRSLWQGDSLYVHYALPGFAPDHLIAAFTIDGATVRPVRSAEGLAVFAPMQPGDYELSIRVISREKGYSASVHVLSLRVMPFWWTSAFGLFVIVTLSTLVGFCVVSGYTLRQRTLARELEQLVTERTRDLQIAQDKAQKASTAKSMFLANMSHEIRTPLNAVLGMGNLLLDSPLTDEQREFATSIQRGGNALHGIVGDILDFAEIDNGSVKRRDALANLPDLVHELVATYADYASEKGLFFGYDIDPLPVHVSIDAQKLRSAISHLLGNAIKFTPSGEVHVEVRFEGRHDGGGGGGDQLRVRISDTGIGISDADYLRIFDVFEQADNSNTRRFGGTGLGLAIVKTYVECLGGHVALESTLGEGSTFTLQLPLRLTGRHVVQPPLIPSEDVLHVSPSSAHPAFRQQLTQLFSGGEFADPSLPTAGDVFSGAADVLLHGYTTAEDLDAFRQNEAYRLAHRRGSVIAVVRTLHQATDLGLLPHEQALTYPLRPQRIVELAAEWRSTKAERAATATPDDEPASVAARLTGPGSSATEETTQSLAATVGHAATAYASTDNASPANASTAPELQPNLGHVAETPPAASVPAKPRPVFFDLGAEHPLKIMVAEDNPMNKMLILTVLTKLGYKADCVENGRLAVERFGAEAYDLILMDIHMPEMDGLQATREIRDRYFERPVTICALTANASEEGRVECLAAGLDEFMTKPLQVPALVTLLRKVEPLASRMIAAAGAADVRSGEACPHHAASVATALRS